MLHNFIIDSILNLKIFTRATKKNYFLYCSISLDILKHRTLIFNESTSMQMMSRKSPEISTLWHQYIKDNPEWPQE